MINQRLSTVTNFLESKLNDPKVSADQRLQILSIFAKLNIHFPEFKQPNQNDLNTIINLVNAPRVEKKTKFTTILDYLKSLREGHPRAEEIKNNANKNQLIDFIFNTLNDPNIDDKLKADFYWSGLYSFNIILSETERNNIRGKIKNHLSTLGEESEVWCNALNELVNSGDQDARRKFVDWRIRIIEEKKPRSTRLKVIPAPYLGSLLQVGDIDRLASAIKTICDADPLLPRIILAEIPESSKEVKAKFLEHFPGLTPIDLGEVPDNYYK